MSQMLLDQEHHPVPSSIADDEPANLRTVE